MPQATNLINYGKEFLNWDVEEYRMHRRGVEWYLLAGIASAVFIGYALFTSNFLFAVVVVMTFFVIVLHDSGVPNEVKFSITDNGIVLGEKFYDYDKLKNFAIVYKPNEDVKTLYFEFEASIRPRLSIPLYDQDPLIIRENLLKYLAEDLERTDESLSDAFSRNLKI